MKRKITTILLSLLGLFISNQAICQFVKKLNAYNGFSVAGIIKLNSNEIICYGSNANSEIIIFSIDNNAVINWQKKYTPPVLWGGITCGIFASDSTLVFAGSFTNAPIASNPNSDVLIIKTDLQGNIIYSKRFFDVNPIRYYYIRKIMETSQGNYVLSGEVGFHNGNIVVPESFICCTSSSGNLLWQRQTNAAWFYDNAIELPGGDILVSSMGNNGVLSRFTAAGALVQNIRSVAFTFTKGIKLLSDSSVIICGSYVTPNNLESEMVLLKLSPNLIPLWAYRYELDSAIYGPRMFVNYDIGEDASGNIIGAGNYNEQYVSSLGGFYYSIDTSGNPVWSKLFSYYLWEAYSIIQSGSSEYIVGPDAFTNHSVLVQNSHTGSLCSSSDPQLIRYPISDSIFYPIVNQIQTFLQKDSVNYIIGNPQVVITNICAPTGIDELAETQPFTLFPNPANDKLTITNSLNQPLTFTFYNTAGIEVKKVNVVQTESEIEIKELAAGCYTVIAFDINGKLPQVQKVVVIH